MEEQQRKRKPIIPLDPRMIAIYRRVAGEYADHYIDDFLFHHLRRVMQIDAEADIEAIHQALEDPYLCLRAFYGHYAFARRGKDRDDLAKAALQALEQINTEKDFEEVLKAEDGVELWEKFEKNCQELNRKPNENQNRGMIQGMLELSQEIYRIDRNGSIASWFTDVIAQTGQLETQFLRIVDIRGVGPKSTSTFMRDISYIFDMEESIDPADKIYVQPIDRWLRLISRYVVPEKDMEKAADWIVAGKVSKYSRRARVSGLRFNMGTTYFGQKIVRDPSNFEDCIKQVLLDAAEQNKAERGF